MTPLHREARTAAWKPERNRHTVYSNSNWRNRHSRGLTFYVLPKQKLTPPSCCTSILTISILCRWRSSPWQLLQSSCSKWMIKKRWRGFTGGWYAWHPKSPCSLQASQAEQATAVLQTSLLSFIYFCWNIDACYERFKIMCLPFPLPEHTVSNT